MKKQNLAIAVSTTLVSGLASTSVQAETLPASIDSNPFAITELSSGYMQIAEADTEKDNSMKMKDGTCGEGKCGSAMQKGSEEKTAEGKCAGNKPMSKPAMKKTDKDMEGKCGEGKCGSTK